LKSNIEVSIVVLTSIPVWIVFQQNKWKSRSRDSLLTSLLLWLKVANS